MAPGVAGNLLWPFFTLITAFYILVVRGGTIVGVMYMAPRDSMISNRKLTHC